MAFWIVNVSAFIIDK